MSENLNNPAGRLRHWLQKAQAYKRENPALNTWGEVFGIDVSDTGGRLEVYSAGARLIDLAVRTRTLMSELPDEYHADALMSDFDEVEQTLGNFVNINRMKMEQFFSPLHGTGWRSLEYADLHLSTKRQEHWIDEDTRVSLNDQVRDLMDAVMEDGDLDVETKLFVTDKLSDVDTALREAKLTGTYAIERATDALIGSFRRDPGFWQRLGEGTLHNLLSTFVVALLLALGHEPNPSIMPPPSAPPAITQGESGQVSTEPQGSQPGDEGGDVVDGEIVEDPDDAP